jgi:hypothetical protein
MAAADITSTKAVALAVRVASRGSLVIDHLRGHVRSMASAR